MPKMVLVEPSDISAALQTLVKSPALIGIWASIVLHAVLHAVLLGVSIIEAG